ncbi:hypothetical protein [Acetobacter sp. P1H12_c]|uniref:hypothetical protein n=1 Tax=Acetobacter sp. P1H12_c TaxID=2762621 RepID=UPI001C03FF00|nr:hypothetical protein [Acetobacter sp. P1H12_c]
MSDTSKLTKNDPLADPRVTKNDDGSYTVQLMQPVQLIKDEPPLTSVTLGRLKGRSMVSMLDAAGEGARLERLLLASVDLVGPKGDAFMENVDAPDFLFLVGVASTFLASGQTTGQ